MSAAVTREKNLEHGTTELTPPAGTGISEKMGARPIAGLAKISGADCGSISDHGMTPLMRAACEGLAGTVKAWIDRGDKVNAKRADGFDALALAAFFGHSQVVWLLLENGADLNATGRSGTPPEMWADARGFVDIGDILREARATKQSEASSPRSALIDESARFSRPAEKEKLEPTGNAGSRLEDPLIDEVTDFETTVTTKPPSVSEESGERKIQLTGDVVARNQSQPTQQQPVIKEPLRALRTLPEINDPPRLVVPEFHPASVFVTRITSSRKTLAALILTMFLVCSGIAAFLTPQISKWLAGSRSEGSTKTTNQPTTPSNPVAVSGTTVTSTMGTPAAVKVESTAPASKNLDETVLATPAETRSVDPTSRSGTAEVSEKDSADTATAGRSESWANSSTGNRVPEARENKREFSAAASMSRPMATAPKQRDARTAKFKQQAVAEEQTKPAPLCVETSRSRSVLPTPARSVNDVLGSQPPPPVGIISGKPKSKVIQWP
ncbi:hypothetical protein BH20ACI3_BH20ACI3_32120 [soil metagenome]